MNNNRVLYVTQGYNAIKAFLFAFLAYLLITLMLFLIFMPLHIPVIGILAWICVSTIPFLFQKRFKQLFIREVILEFDNTGFFVKEYTLEKEKLVKNLTIKWEDLKVYKFYFSATNITYLVLYLRNGTSQTFSFKDEKNQDQAIAEKSAFSLFHYFVQEYNIGKQSDKQISFKSGFLTTKLGQTILFAVIILTISAIVLHVIIQPKTSMFSVMGLFIIMGLLVKKKNDKAFYNKIIQLPPRLPED